MLNEDQQNSLKFIKRWWKSNKLYCILDGAGGVGKSYLVDRVLQELPNCRPILLAPTNEALKQLRDKVTNAGEYTFKTVHAALGIAPTTHQKDVKFEQVTLPSFWDDFNLAIIDEVSMLDDWIIEILTSIGIKILGLTIFQKKGYCVG